MVVPYAPGIPILMPGERACEADGPVVKYLLALQELDRKCPGLAHDIHGVERSPDRTFRVECVTDTGLTWPRIWCARRAIGEPAAVGASPGGPRARRRQTQVVTTAPCTLTTCA